MNAKLCKRLRKDVYGEGSKRPVVAYSEVGHTVIATGLRHDYQMNKRTVKALH